MGNTLGNHKKRRGKSYLFYALLALELFMSFSFLGYLHLEPISLTFVYIPVLAAGCLLGPKEATLVGAVFGLASMWKASAFYVGAGDAVFSPFFSGKPLESVWLSVGCRTLFGLLSGLLYQAARKSRHPAAGILLVTSFGRVLHSFLVYSSMGLFFPETGFHGRNAWEDVFQAEFLISTVVVDAVILLTYLAQNSRRGQAFKERMERADELGASVSPKRKIWLLLFASLLFAAYCVAVYFTNRMDSVLRWHGLDLSEHAARDLMHIQIQFLLGVLSLTFLVFLFLTLYQKNLSFLYYEAKLDGLTGLLGRTQFFQTGKRLLEEIPARPSGRNGCFIILDLDEFKEINDRFGHPEGDRVLRRVGEILNECFASKGISGRLGGDEFVVLVVQPLEQEEMKDLLRRLKEEVNRIPCKEKTVSCSIGVIPVEEGYTVEELYRNADHLLYEAKKNGKNQFVFGYRYRDREA